MMVNDYTETHSLLALQIDHSRVAGFLAAHWGNDEFDRPEPYTSIVLAAQEHDQGWWEWELLPQLNDEGHPHDYISSVRNLGDGVWTSFMQNGIDRLTARDPYAGLASQMHTEGLLTQGRGLLPYMPDFSKLPTVPEFLARGRERQRELIAQLRDNERFAPYVTEEALERTFEYMEVFDQFGQFLCNRYPLNSTARKNGPSPTLSDTPVPTRAGQPTTRITITPLDESTAIVDPYPFDVDPLVVSFPVRAVPKGPYPDQQSFNEAFLRAERIIVTYTLKSNR